MSTNMKFLLLVAISCAVVSSSLIHLQTDDDKIVFEHFTRFAKSHDRQYPHAEEWSHRFQAFKDNWERVKIFNENGDAEYGVTPFSDMTPEEFNSKYLMQSRLYEKDHSAPTAEAAAADAPSSWDWRDNGAVTPVKDQKTCGSCWAFSAAANIEGVWALAGNKPVDISVEQILECDPHDAACYGGWPYKAFTYVIENKGIASAADYPYVLDKTICLANQTFNDTLCPGDGPCTNYCDLTCDAKREHSVAAKISSWTNVAEDEDQIAAYLAKNGPLAVALNAGMLQFYRHGIYNPIFCSPKNLDHAVLLVGYGEESGKKYWIVKNSWGAKWGESGYFRIIRGTGKCGINSAVASAIV